jgi:flagellar biogenesis protein FliO
MIRVFFLILGLLFCTPLPCSETSPTKEEFLQEEESEAPVKQTPLESKTLLIKTVILLAGLVGMLYGGAYLIRRIGGSRFSPQKGSAEIQLIERQFISPKTSVWLIHVQDQPVIVVDSPNGVAVHSLSNPSTEENKV